MHLPGDAGVRDGYVDGPGPARWLNTRPDPSFAVIWPPEASLEDLRTHKATDGLILRSSRVAVFKGLSRTITQRRYP